MQPRFHAQLAAAVLAAAAPLPAAAAPLAAAAVPLAVTAQPADPFAARILAAHNAERALVGSPPLAWNWALAAGAASWAQYMAATGQFAHSDRKARRGIGENLWMGTRGAFTIDAMLRAWASEKRDFVPGIFPANSRSGNWMNIAHYTQVIWPTTRFVGCALASGRGQDFLVCRYSPAGNIDGRPVPAPVPRAGPERGG